MEKKIETAVDAWDVQNAIGCSLINLETATQEEIFEATNRILAFVKSNRDRLTSGCVAEYLEWMSAFVLRLINDLRGIEPKTSEEERKEIESIARHIKALSPELQ